MPSRPIALALAALVALVGALARPVPSLDSAAGAEPTPTLRVGVGRADITPPTGYFMLGWARGDARITGQSTRLYARAVVLERDGRKVALVSLSLIHI